MWLRVLTLGGLVVSTWGAAGGATAGPGDRKPRLIEVRRIWDAAPHSAFTDLIRFKGRWFCTFREGQHHNCQGGRVQVIASADGDTWEPIVKLERPGFDLRDPKLSVAPDGRMMLLCGGSVFEDGKNVARQPFVAFSADGWTWDDLKPVLPGQGWLWRVSWHRGTGYGVAYHLLVPEGQEWTVTLFKTRDGVNYEKVTKWDIPGQPNETTLRFLEDNTAVALVRREGGNHKAWIGTSRPPYEQWSWHESQHRIGGPDFIVLPDGSMWAGGRDYRGPASAMLARMTPSGYTPLLTLPSGGDCSYPAFCWQEDVLWMTYYSSHEARTSIYLAKIRLDPSSGPTTAPASTRPSER